MPSPARTRLGLHAAALAVALVAFGLRLVDLGSTPAGFYCDEASVALDARCLLATGRDQHGAPLPLFLRSFGDWKALTYTACVVPCQLAFDDVAFATRLPAAVFQALFLVAVHALLSRLRHPACGLLGVVLLANEPWLNHFSHVAFDLTQVPLLLALAFLAWLVAVEEPSAAAMAASAAAFVAAAFAYAPARVFAALFLPALALSWRRPLAGTAPGRRLALVFLVVVAALAGPLLACALSAPGFNERSSYLFVLTTPCIGSSWAWRWLEARAGPGTWLEALLTDDVSRRGAVAAVNYLSYYSPRYLFWSGDENLRFGAPDFGVFSPAFAVAFVLGMGWCVRRRGPVDRALLCWLALYAVPGALTWEDIPHGGRGIVGHPGFELVAALGLWDTLAWLRDQVPGRPRAAPAALAALGLLVGGLWARHAVAYYDFYWHRYGLASDEWMQWGFRELMRGIAEHHAPYEATVLVSTGLHYEPEVFALLYGGVDPAAWLRDRRLPWRLVVHRDLAAAAPWRERVLYVFAPVPPDLDPAFVQVGRFRSRDPAVEPYAGAFEYHPRP